jgi:hypothetical protein
MGVFVEGDFGVYMDLVTAGGQEFFGTDGSHPPAELAEFFCTTCSPPQAASSLHAVFDVSDDRRFNSSCPGCTYNGDFTFLASPLPIPSFGGDMRTRFTMTGVLRAFAPVTREERLNLHLSGGGTEVIVNAGLGLLVTYQFKETPSAPTPEPATALLIASAVVVTFVRGKHWRAESRPS